MFAGNRPEGSMSMIFDFGIADILFKFPEDQEQLKDEKLVIQLTQKSVDICHVLGHIFDGFKKQIEENGEVKYCGRTISTDKNTLKELQMRCFYTGMLLPFFDYTVIRGKGAKKAPQSVVLHILATSLTRSNEIQKFVMETSKHVPKAQDFEDRLMANAKLLENSDVKLELGKYLRESGPRQSSIQICAAATYYCKEVGTTVK